MMTDPISDMLTRIRNASMVKKRVIELPYSKMKFAIAKILEAEGHLTKVEDFKLGNKPMLRLAIKYDAQNQPTITSLKRISKPGRRVYTRSRDLQKVLSGFGFAIISTPNGLMTNNEAKKRKLGGEVICEIY